MTSTEFSIGLGDGRNSSKVLKPPGGGCSDIFGTQSAQQHAPSKTANTQNRLFGSEPEPPTPSKSNRMKSSIFESEETVSKPSTKKYVQRNPITGEVVEIDLPMKNGEEKTDEEKNEQNNTEKTDEQNREKVEEENGEKIEQNSEVKNEDNKENSGSAVEEAPAKKHVPSVRVKQPPGGMSSGIF